MKIHLATSRAIGKRCSSLVPNQTSMEDCEIFISVLYDKIVTPEFIKSKKVCFNFHPGILPMYRGAGAYSWAIINKEKETGVTLHEIDQGIDHGKIIEINKFPIEPTDTAETLFKKAEETIFFMFKHWFPRLLTGEYPIAPQDEDLSSIYYRKDLEKIRDLTPFIRAFSFTGKPNAFYTDRQGQKHEIIW